MSRKTIKTLCIILSVLLALAIIGLILTLREYKSSSVSIKSFAIAGSTGQVKTERVGGKKQYIIEITLPADCDFTKCVANIELKKGASISSESPCLVDYLGGRPVLNLTLENRDLIIINGERTRHYGFKIELMKEQ